ncbi:hypothetical protein Bpfe_009227 [Biomphalaria pfeifferi]|uniref:Uncharacterized protein n=1 Tax=Biomphalaria pfeifferi TaxID=112525 RepID=A0AAD8BV56_BIOPF|nr:hypothetical protein Bpfe_009227 [Biomphalaria pfeifferi]
MLQKVYLFKAVHNDSRSNTSTRSLLQHVTRNAHPVINSDQTIGESGKINPPLSSDHSSTDMRLKLVLVVEEVLMLSASVGKTYNGSTQTAWQRLNISPRTPPAH